ncbi:hypothetical protein LMH87_012080 [Akanthomyces muscarius]|uniref:Uncharacterized protein n=1 Tax=Akanthomyces muscarius TaxID=2231603 RepID=A0A9W8QDT7_AKAMU|nr:hypothetical protein LMH87_012080 [Akanthomyces muscarius]KAJ4151378.1 hypothetical protein LMH87_012080 [Akanthomyces muscarius]
MISHDKRYFYLASRALGKGFASLLLSDEEQRLLLPCEDVPKRLIVASQCAGLSETKEKNTNTQHKP